MSQQILRLHFRWTAASESGIKKPQFRKFRMNMKSLFIISKWFSIWVVKFDSNFLNQQTLRLHFRYTAASGSGKKTQRNARCIFGMRDAFHFHNYFLYECIIHTDIVILTRHNLGKYKIKLCYSLKTCKKIKLYES